MLATGIIHEEAGNWRRPILQHANKAALRNVFGDLLFIGQSDANSSEHRLNYQVSIVDDEWAVHVHRDRLSTLLKLPPIWTACKAQGDAPMIFEILWLLRDAS